MMNSLRKHATIVLAMVFTALIVSSCAKSGTDTDNSSLPQVSGGRSAVIIVDSLMQRTLEARQRRSAPLLGIFIANYLSRAVATPALSALKGIAAHAAIARAQGTVVDPDYDLLQAFADALQVDVADLLNRSVNRQEMLDTYTEALHNVAMKANDRFKELTVAKKTLEDRVRVQQRDKATIERDVQKAITAKEFGLASEKQRSLSEAEALLAATTLELKRTEDIVDTLDKLLTLFGERMLAMEKNREALIAGTKVVDMPGVSDLKLIQKGQGFKASGSRGNNSFDNLFLTPAQN